MGQIVEIMGERLNKHHTYDLNLSLSLKPARGQTTIFQQELGLTF